MRAAVSKIERPVATIFVMLLIILALSSASIAQEVSFEQAVELGEDNNFEIEQKREVIKSLERQLAVLEAGLDWSLGIGSNMENSTGLTIIEDQEILSLSLQGGKTTIDGLSINSNLSLNTELDNFDNLDQKYNFHLDLSKRLYPIMPTKTEKEFIQVDNSLIIAEAELERLASEKKVDWLESYYKILRLRERLEYSQIAVQLALDNLSEVEAQSEIGEAGQEQLLMAEINVQKARLQNDQIISSIMQAEDGLTLELGLSDADIQLREHNISINKMFSLEKSNIDTIDKTTVELLKKNNVQLQEIMLNKEYAEQELKWQLKSDDIKVDTFSSYNYSSAKDKGNWQVGVGISYDFYDGGKQELSIEGNKTKIKNLEKQYTHTLKQLKLQLKALLDQQKLNEMKLKSAETNIEKAKLEEKLFTTQYKEGMISKNQLKEKNLAVKQAEINYKEVQDQLLIGKLRIAVFLGLY